MRQATVASSKLFGDPAGNLHITQNEEGAGIIPVFDLLGEGWYLTNLQAHGPFPSWMFQGLNARRRKLFERELVEPGQLIALFIPQDISDLPKTEPASTLSCEV